MVSFHLTLTWCLVTTCRYCLPLHSSCIIKARIHCYVLFFFCFASYISILMISINSLQDCLSLSPTDVFVFCGCFLSLPLSFIFLYVWPPCLHVHSTLYLPAPFLGHSLRSLPQPPLVTKVPAPSFPCFPFFQSGLKMLEVQLIHLSTKEWNKVK